MVASLYYTVDKNFGFDSKLDSRNKPSLDFRKQ